MVLFERLDSPAGLGDDHLGAVLVELLPQLLVLQGHLGGGDGGDGGGDSGDAIKKLLWISSLWERGGS